MLNSKQTFDFLSNNSFRDLIIKNLKETPIKMAQLDFNGICNVGCWYCPVKYYGNQPFTHMSVENMRKVLKNIKESKAVDEKFDWVFTAHYNEILLYKHFEEMLEAFREYNIKSCILSNGTPLSPQKTQVLNKYKDVILDVTLNIPTIFKEDWMLKTNSSEQLYNILLRNLKYYDKFGEINYNIQINFIADYLSEYALKDGIVNTEYDIDLIEEKLKIEYPRAKVVRVGMLSDRSGELSRLNVLTNNVNMGMAVGCGNLDEHASSRIYAYLHMNPKGDLFLCCNDYFMDFKFGNILEDSLDNIWYSENHIQTIENALMHKCSKCASGISLNFNFN